MSGKTRDSAIKARIGMVNYINTAPIHEIWKEKIDNPDWQLVEAYPAALNQKLFNGSIDLGFVSSIVYAERSHLYKVISDLSISANGPVGSVFLFSQIPIEQLDKCTVLLSAESKTSSYLVKVILERFCGIAPLYQSEALASVQFDDYPAVMAIGDDALRIKHTGKFPYCLDLGERWQQETGLPFVFALCVVREDYLNDHLAQVKAIREALINCRDSGMNQLCKICEKVAPKIPMSINGCIAYLHAIEYDLDHRKIKALELFFTYLQELGMVGAKALPLRFFKP